VSAEEPFDPAISSPTVAAFARGLDPDLGPLVTRIHPADEMYRYDLAQPYRTPEAAALSYLSIGHLVFQAVDDVIRWRFGSFDAVGAFLDFASGYGRSTRFVARALNPGKITAAEIDPDAGPFLARAFGVHGIVSGPEPSDLRLDGLFGAILACSFFSHLPADLFEAWLARLHAQLAPGGVLMFSVHGMDLLSGPERDPRSGMVFLPVSETKRLDGAQYGTSYVSEEFVRAAASRAAGRHERLLYFPYGLAGYQDLYVLLRPPLPPALDLRIARAPFGSLDGSVIGEDGAVSLEGWASGDFDEKQPEVVLHLGEGVAAVSTGDGDYGSRRRWSFAFPASAVTPDEIVWVEARSPRGRSKVLVAGTLRPYLPPGLRGEE
jgi:SAM-dependent methyltransferase